MREARAQDTGVGGGIIAAPSSRATQLPAGLSSTALPRCLSCVHLGTVACGASPRAPATAGRHRPASRLPDSAVPAPLSAPTREPLRDVPVALCHPVFGLP